MQLPQYPRYESYKDSGSDWIEELPSHWEVQPLRANFAFRNEKNDPVITEDILSLSIANGVTLYSEEGRGGNKRKDDLTAYKIARPDDIVLNSMNVIVGAVGRSKYFGAISPVYYAMYAIKPGANISYYDKVFSNSAFQKGLLRHGKGILMKLSGTGQLNTIRMKISQNDLKNVLLPSPPPDEADAVIAFLDDKTDKIDRAVKIKEEQIALLRERKQIIIQETATKGLNSDAPTKDSGIDWIGEIPAHWDVENPKWLFRHRKEKARKGEQQLAATQKYGVIPQQEYMELEGRRIVQVFLDFDILKHVEAGDFVMSMRSFQGGIEYSEYKGCVSSAYVAMEPGEQVHAPYYKYLLKSPRFIEALQVTSNLVRDGQALRFDNFSMVTLPVVPLEEQRQIAIYIDESLSKIDKAIELKQRQIEALKEYKATLINAAVTGKIKVI